MKIKKETIAPLLETFLYISVFGAALGSRIDELHGIDYVVFVIPGLIMMAWAISLFQQLFIDPPAEVPGGDPGSAPCRRPRRSSCCWPSRWAASAAGWWSPCWTFTAASFLVDLPVEHILVLIPALFLVGFFFARSGS